MREAIRKLRRFLLALALVTVTATAVSAQTTSFTYQGRLTDGGTPASGNYDLQFALFDSAAGGNQIGATQTATTVSVSSGGFTVALDFGVSAFPGANRFLEISVKPSGIGSFITLSPRQQISSTPYAIRTLSAQTADTATNATQLGGVAASSYVQTNDSRLNDSRLPTAGSPNYIQSNPNVTQPGANFNISGDGTAGGTLTGNLINATTQYNIGGNRMLSAPGTNNLFAGPQAGQTNTSGSGNAFVGAGTGQANTVGINNSFFGLNAGLNNVGFISAFSGQVTTGKNNSFFGVNAGKSIQQGVDNSFFGNNAGGSSTQGDANSFFGSQAGSASKGDANSFFGNGAGSGNNGTRNSFFGVVAGAVGNGGAASGDDNTFVGTFAGESNTASQNSFFGSGAGENNSSGTSNAFFGYQAGLNNNSGTRNTFIGAGAGNADPTVQVKDSTAIGAFAVVQPCGLGDAVAVGSGANANCLSTALGKGATASGIGSIAIGDGATASGFGSIAIGPQTLVSASNTIAIGPGGGGFRILVPGPMEIGTGITTVGTPVLRVVHIPQLPHTSSVCFDSPGNLVDRNGSSLRFKTNVHPFLGSLDVVRRLKPINFNWKQNGQPDIGLAAEDVARVAPSFTYTNSKGEITGVKYERLDILLINAIKEQQKEIEQGRATNKRQQSQLALQQEQVKRQQMEIDGLKRLICRDHPDTDVCSQGRKR